MERVKAVLKRLLCLPLPLIICIAIPAFALVSYVLSQALDGPLAYLSYASSAYALALCVIWSIRAGRTIRERVLRHPFIGRYLKDMRYRTRISLYQGLLINLFYIAVKLASGIATRSWWFIVLAAYYALLAVMRFLLLWHWDGIGPEAELHRYRLCGVVLLLMNQALAGIVALVVHQNRGYDYPGVMIYAMAAYSFYAVLIAAVNLIKFRKHGSPVLSAAKAISLAAAAVSVLSLETAMLARFGGDHDPLFRRRMTAATGGGVCALVLAMAVFMIVRGTLRLKNCEKR